MMGLDAAVAALVARCDGGPLGDGVDGLRGLVAVDGTGRICLAPEWPSDTMTRGDFPRGSITAMEWPTGAGVYRVRVTLDWWEWAQSPDPDAVLAAIDLRCRDLFDGKRWQHAGAWISSTLMPAAMAPVRPGGKTRLTRRTRDYALLIQVP